MICKRCGHQFYPRQNLSWNGSAQCPECKTIYRKKNTKQRGLVQTETNKRSKSLKKRKPKQRFMNLIRVFAAVLCIVCVTLFTNIDLADTGVDSSSQSSSGENSASKIQSASRMQLHFTIDGKDLTAYYTGVLVNNQPFGEGIYEFEDTYGPWSFVGSLENGVFSNGIMTDYPYTMTFEDDQSYSKYTGPFKENRQLRTGDVTSRRQAVKQLGISRNNVKKYWDGETVPWECKPYEREPAVLTPKDVLFVKECVL